MCDSGPPFPVLVLSGLAHTFTQHLGQLNSQQCFKLTKSRQKFKVRNYYREIILMLGGSVHTYAHMQTHKRIASLWRACRSKRIYTVALFFFLIFFFLRKGLSLNPEPDISARMVVQPISPPLSLTHQTPTLPWLWVIDMRDWVQLSKWALRIRI